MTLNQDETARTPRRSRRRFDIAPLRSVDGRRALRWYVVDMESVRPPDEFGINVDMAIPYGFEHASEAFAHAEELNNAPSEPSPLKQPAWWRRLLS